MAATVPGASTVGISEEKKLEFQRVLGMGFASGRNDHELYASFKADSLNRFYVPAVMMGHQQPAPPSARTVHILGHDQRSKFLSHSLQDVFDSVQPIQSQPSNTTYRNISANPRRRWDKDQVEPNRGLIRETAGPARRSPRSVGETQDHISNLIVAGSPSHTVKLLEQVKHRVDDRTAVCFMQDGLGVAEAATRQVFTDAASRPSMMLGHMSHSLALDRSTDSVRSMTSNYRTALAEVQQPKYLDRRRERMSELDRPSADTATEISLRTQGLLTMLSAARDVRATGVPLDSWLRYKIPSLMFAAVADPVCVMLDCHYDHLLRNSAAHSLIGQLLDEMASVVEGMPELRGSALTLRAALQGEGIRKMTMKQIAAKKNAASKMALQIQRGQLTDIDYLNGYFIRRATKMGLKLPANEMVVGMVKAKHKARLEKLRGYVPFDLTSRL